MGSRHWIKWIAALALQVCGVLAMLEWRHAKAIRILLFHRVAETPVNDGMTVSLEAFRGQLSYLAERYRFVSLDEVSNMINGHEPLISGGIVVTFDDGYQDNYTLARPVLISHAIPATIFVATGAVDGRIPIWTHELREAVLGGSRRVVDLRPFGWELWRFETVQDRQIFGSHVLRLGIEPQRGVRQLNDVGAVVDLKRDAGCHAGQEFQFRIRCPDNDGIGDYVLRGR